MSVHLRDVTDRQCRFPLWDEKERRDFQCFGKPSEPGRPYCAEHTRLAYYRPVLDEEKGEAA